MIKKICYYKITRDHLRGIQTELVSRISLKLLNACATQHQGIQVPQLHPWCLPYTFQYEIGFLTVAGCLCMTRFQWKLNLWIWCSGVWPMNCFDRNRCHLGCVDLWDDKDLLGSEVPEHLDHGRSNEPMNFVQSGVISSFDLPWSEWSRFTYPHSDRLKEPTLNNLHATGDQQT